MDAPTTVLPGSLRLRNATDHRRHINYLTTALALWPWHKYPTRPSQISGYRIWSKARKYPGYIREIYEKVTLDIRHARRVSVTIICVYIFFIYDRVPFKYQVCETATATYAACSEGLRAGKAPSRLNTCAR